MNDRTNIESLHILVVEDNPTQVMLLEVAFQRVRGVQISLTHARSLEEALVLLQAESFDAVLLDLGLPDSAGLETFTRIQRHSSGVPILILTGQENETLAVTAVRTGAQDYLVKGTLDSVMLVRTIRYAIERKQTEAALRASEERFRRIFEEGPLGIAVVAPDSTVLHANSKLCEMLGYSEQELTSFTTARVTHPDDLNADSQLTQQLFTGEIPSYQLEKRYLTKEGKVMWGALTGTLIRDRAGHPLYALGIVEDITGRKQAEADQARLAAIVESSYDAIVSMDVTSIIVSWNRAAEQLFGYSATEIIGQPLSLLLPPERVQETHQVMEKLRQGEYLQPYETERLRKDGHRVSISLAVSPLRNASGQIIGFSAIVRDITEKKQASETQARLASIVETSDDSIISMNLEGIILSWNPGAARLYGYTAAEAIGLHIGLLTPPDQPLEIPAILERIRLGQGVRALETHRLCKNGSLVDVSLTISPLVDTNGHVIGSSAIARDISERKRAEETQARLAAIVEASDDAIISKTLDGIITTWNHGAEQVYGYTVQEAVGRPMDILLPLDRPQEEEHILQKIRDGERIRNLATERIRKDGKVISISLSSSPLLNAAGGVIAASSIAHDITALKSLEKERARSLALLQATLESTADGILVVNGEGRITHYNQQFLMMWRIPEQIIQSGENNRVIEYVKEQLIHPQEFEESGKTPSAELERRGIDLLHFKDGRVFERHTRVRHLTEQDIGRVLSYHDITERVQSENLIRSSEANLAAAQQIAHLGSWAWSLQSLNEFEKNSLSWSDEVFRIFGYQPGAFEASYGAFISAVHHGDRDKVEAALRSSLAIGQNYHIEHRVVWPDGRERIIDGRAEIAFDEDGTPLMLRGTVQDITEQKHLEEKLRSLAARLSTIREEERTQISRDVHDVLGQALTGLKMDVAWLEERLLDSRVDLQDSMLQKIRTMRPLIDTTIQSVQRIAAQLRPALLDDFGLEAAIEWQVQEWQERTHIHCDYVSSLGDIELSTEQSTAVFRILQEALTNITRHAVASRISIILEENDGQLRLEVQDNGRGMKERRTSAGNVKSLGIVGMQERARLVGGEVIINSLEGKGTTVIVRIPLSPEQVAQGLR